MIIENLDMIEKNILTACATSGRKRDEITLIAVSKTKPVSMLEEVYSTGIRDFGENKVQELSDKFEILPKDIKWHMIGHLQTNKVKYLMDKAYLIHSVDSLKLAKEIEKQAEKANRIVDILIEVNIAEEESKFGLAKEEVLALIKEISLFPHIRIKGLMTIAPYVENPEDNRLYFRQIKQLSVDIDSQNIDNVSMNILSMGMSGDYMVAIEEGATMIRVGTSIFGERVYTNI
ncbi:MAG: YggS family pyridoxal phosphate-dependent enzyme [Lachnospiraceae bacterium]|nr:YggS family pyridoxal phosphate-dependent enzyme [Lachnospiraceae bacterium]